MPTTSGPRWIRCDSGLHTRAAPCAPSVQRRRRNSLDGAVEQTLETTAAERGALQPTDVANVYAQRNQLARSQNARASAAQGDLTTFQIGLVRSILRSIVQLQCRFDHICGHELG
jgi:hypothetical protein